MIPAATLTREEQLVLAAAGAGLSIEHQIAVLRTVEQGVVWRGVQFLAERNNADALMHRALRNLPVELVPEQVQAKFRKGYLATYRRNQRFAQVIAQLNDAFTHAGTKAVFFRGLVLAENVYGNPSLRRFADIDVLVRRSDVPAALRAIERIGGARRKSTLPNGYYYRNHFHLERVMGNGHGSTVELHWNLDHRYTLFTIDVAGLIDRAVPVRIGAFCVSGLEPVDDLLALCLHAAKHCPAVRYFPTSPLLPRRILLDGWLNQVLDIAMALQRYDGLDWDRFVATARAWGIESVAGGAFAAVHAILGVAPPLSVRNRLQVAAPCVGIERILVTAFVDPSKTLQPLEQRTPLARLILRRWRFQEDAVFHPVRLLDLVNYFSPRRADLARWSRRAHLRPYWWWWMRHVTSSVGSLALGVCDLLGSRLTSCVRRPPSATRPTRCAE